MCNFLSTVASNMLYRKYLYDIYEWSAPFQSWHYVFYIFFNVLWNMKKWFIMRSRSDVMSLVYCFIMIWDSAHTSNTLVNEMKQWSVWCIFSVVTSNVCLFERCSCIVVNCCVSVRLLFVCIWSQAVLNVRASFVFCGEESVWVLHRLYKISGRLVECCVLQGEINLACDHVLVCRE